jgi:hypothetical protein
MNKYVTGCLFLGKEGKQKRGIKSAESTKSAKSTVRRGSFSFPCIDRAGTVPPELVGKNFTRNSLGDFLIQETL